MLHVQGVSKRSKLAPCIQYGMNWGITTACTTTVKGLPIIWHTLIIGIGVGAWILLMELRITLMVCEML